ncbi:MAG: hypothetical protein ABSB58_03165 [Gemmatimonadales bacterium]|jgi:hypothetical protein
MVADDEGAGGRVGSGAQDAEGALRLDGDGGVRQRHDVAVAAVEAAQVGDEELCRVADAPLGLEDLFLGAVEALVGEEHAGDGRGDHPPEGEDDYDLDQRERRAPGPPHCGHAITVS